ncbi:hypothetical protein LV779_34730 [Streptomyces thinghirensis]|nr:hypothetical protein [Streptomyces thinghirensis]
MSLLLLKPLASALADGDTVHAPSSSAAPPTRWSGGRPRPCPAPPPPGKPRQAARRRGRERIAGHRLVWRRTRTGTALGDPIEVRAHQGVRRKRRPLRCSAR